MRGFFRDVGRILRVREAGGSLLGLAAFQAIITAGSGVLFGQAVTQGADVGEFLRALLIVGTGAALGSGLASWQDNLRRCLGLVPFGATGLAAALGWGAATLAPGSPLPLVPCLLLGFMGGLVNVPLRAVYQAAVPADARGNAMSVMNTALYVAIVGLALVMLALGAATPGQDVQVVFLGVLTAVGALAAWWWLLPPAIEQVLEVVMAPIYRIHAFGPGAGRVPIRGPLLVVANHSSYLDPFWIGKVMPRRITPMMTSIFYDLPGIRWLMVHVVGAIRVPVATFRRQAPELAEAAAVLRAGGCVLIFPEAILRRTEEQLIRPFGQGAWHLLRGAPDTRVQVCWIEGGWGSYSSYWNGMPMENKPLDFWRPIRIALAEARSLDPAILADQKATRTHLMKAVLQCHHFLGLDVPESGGAAEPRADAKTQASNS
jgi:1-acyl-sn-glycerol-3-phosphate acyltransferase